MEREYMEEPALSQVIASSEYLDLTAVFKQILQSRLRNIIFSTCTCYFIFNAFSILHLTVRSIDINRKLKIEMYICMRIILPQFY
jgi:hypothetical protein